MYVRRTLWTTHPACLLAWETYQAAWALPAVPFLLAGHASPDGLIKAAFIICAFIALVLIAHFFGPWVEIGLFADHCELKRFGRYREFCWADVQSIRAINWPDGTALFKSIAIDLLDGDTTSLPDIYTLGRDDLLRAIRDYHGNLAARLAPEDPAPTDYLDDPETSTGQDMAAFAARSAFFGLSRIFDPFDRNGE